MKKTILLAVVLLTGCTDYSGKLESFNAGVEEGIRIERRRWERSSAALAIEYSQDGQKFYEYPINSWRFVRLRVGVWPGTSVSSVVQQP